VHRLRRALAVGTVTALALTLAPASAHAADPERLARQLVREVSLQGVNRHLVAFQRIADTNGGTRAASTPGHLRSSQYVYDTLAAAGYDVSYQEFPFTFEQALTERASEVSPTPRTLHPHVMSGSPNTPDGGITAPLGVVPVDATPGCEPADFAGGSYAGRIALIQRGSCTFLLKQQNAAAAGAIGVLVYNNSPDPAEALGGTLGTGASPNAPTGGISRAEGETLAADAAAGPVTVTLDLRTLTEQRVTRNVVAETTDGRADNVVTLGAHLDSVVAGPGVNDNGSGAATLLEVALKLARHPVPNKVRFGFWSAEEFGLLGSAFYVTHLPFERQLDIALYMNFDMLGSPNGGRFVLDGDDSDKVGSGPGPYGSAAVEQAYTGYFDSRGLVHDGADFTGRSDYGSFIAAGIPSGGLNTGSDGRKTPEQVVRYGGVAGQPYDGCYHQACDNLGNVNRTLLAQNATAVAWVTGLFAVDTSAVNGSVTARRARAAKARTFAVPNGVPAA
jgi:Zn-dependent M28 family amino/carboxypeptidase